MTDAHAAERAHHMARAAKNIRALLNGHTFEDLEADPFMRAAFERFLEIISEASRHIPDDWKAQFGPDVPWREVATLGNVLRHIYQRVELTSLWRIYSKDLATLEAAVDAMLARHDPDGVFTP